MSPRAERQQTRKEAIPLKLASVEELLRLKQELHDLIARRAYEIFEKRGKHHGRNVDDWLQAESEIQHSCRHEVIERPDSFLLRADLPGEFTAEQIKVSIEPHRIIVSGEKPISSLYLEGRTTQARSGRQRIFRVHELPAAVDPSRSEAVLNGENLELRMPKLKAMVEPEKMARGA